MIKIFRKKRHDTIENLPAEQEDNKAGKSTANAGRYLLYALGEIALVVVGILIALSIDNWNQQLKEREMEQTLLIQLKNEYEKNLAQLDKKIATRKLIIQSGKDLLTYFDNPQTAINDSLLLKINNLSFATTYDPIDNDLVKSGKINIIKSEKLKLLLTSWSSDVIQVKESENIYWNRYLYQIWPLLSKTGLTRTIATTYWKNIEDFDYLMNNDSIKSYDYGKSKNAMDPSELLHNTELESLVANAIGSNIFTNLESHTLRQQILEILTILNHEIKKE